jgi:hypothetical protein
MADPIKGSNGVKTQRALHAKTARKQADSPRPKEPAAAPSPQPRWATAQASLIPNWIPRRGSASPPQADAPKSVSTTRAGSRVPVSAGVLTLGRAMLQARGATATDADVQRLLDRTPGLAPRLSLLEQQAGDPAGLQEALRDLMVNAPETMRGAGGSPRSVAEGYARDVGFKDLSFDGGRVAAITTGGDRVDLGALPSPPSIEDLGKLVNGSRFGTPSVVPPPPALKPSDTFDIDNAHLADHLSSLAYQDPSTVKSQLEQWGYDVSTFRWIENKDTDTQGFVVNDRSGNTFATFRGTESMKDAETDADARFVAAPWAGGGNVHAGFSGALDSVWPDMQAAIRQARTAAGDKGDVVFAGHSLGAGLTTLAAMRATSEGLLPANTARTKVYPVASPRVGDEQFAAAYNEKLPQTHRLVNFSKSLLLESQDVVTQVPPQSLGYRHVGNLVRVSNDGVRFVPREGDIANPHIEKLKGDVLQKYLKDCMIASIDKRHAPDPSFADRFARAWKLPSFTAHFSGEYLRRSGTAALKR